MTSTPHTRLPAEINLFSVVTSIYSCSFRHAGVLAFEQHLSNNASCSELINGIKVYSKEGEELGLSQRAAFKGITQVVTSRVIMAAPGMCKYRDATCGFHVVGLLKFPSHTYPARLCKNVLT